jgi:peptidoglycan LD-endopeptidase CwlK
MNNFKLGSKSIDKLAGVHPLLIICVQKALERSEVDFTVLEGLRTAERQKQLVDDGKSQTLNSLHLKGLAVDLAPLPINWNDIDAFLLVSKAMKSAAQELGIKITFGGDWKTFKDYPHYQLEV